MKKTNLEKNTFILSLGIFLNKGLMFIMVPFFSRWLSTEDYGTFDVFTTYVALLIPFITLGCSNAVFRLAVDKDRIEDKIFYISNGAMIVIIDSIIALGALLLVQLFIPIHSFSSFCVMLVCEVLDNYFQGYLRAIKKLDMYALCKSLGTVFTAAFVTIFIRVLHMKLDGILLGYALGFLVSDLMVCLLTKYPSYFSLRAFSIKGIKELLSYSLPLIPNDISWWIINVSDRSIIKMFLGAAANGIYAIAYKVPNICSAVFGVFNISWQESASEVVNDEDRNVFFQNVFSKMLSVLLSLCGGMLSCNFILFDWIFDNKYYEARLYAPILVSSIIFASLSQFYGGIQISLKRPKENGITTVIGALVNLVVHFALVRIIGLYAAAVSTIISNITVMTLRQYKLRDIFTVHLSREIVVYSLIYCYFFVFCYIDTILVIRVINLLLAGIVFVIVNKDFIKRFSKTLQKISR